jgi:sulfatase maturation enzyme AslB (radical SAM superfamily)
MKKALSLNRIVVPADYDYVGIYLTDECFLRCPYCITNHHGSNFIGRKSMNYLSPKEWIRALNRLALPENVPITLQGGEPFLYKGIWEILDNITHKVDIMTALPSFLEKESFLKLKSLEWNKRESPYPTIRVSFHKGQNDFKELVDRIAELDDLLSIGLYYLSHPAISEAEINAMKGYAKEKGVEFRFKEFLGVHNGKMHGTIKYPGSADGEIQGIKVHCRNTVVPVAPDGEIYLCHSDLYFNRRNRSLGNILDSTFVFPVEHLPCLNFGLCSECDVKIKTNHYQEYGYTSVNIRFSQNEAIPSASGNEKE